MKGFLLAGAIAVALLRTSALADITSVSFSGPGGTGTDGLTGGTLTEPRLTYTSIDYIDVTITIDAAGSYLVNEAPGFGYVHNTTGQAWAGFQLTILPGSTTTFTSDWFDAASDLTTVAQTPATIVFSGGTVPDSGFFEPNGHFSALSSGTVVIRETPLAEVPEPTTSAAMLFGSLILFSVCRKRG